MCQNNFVPLVPCRGITNLVRRWCAQAVDFCLECLPPLTPFALEYTKIEKQIARGNSGVHKNTSGVFKMCGYNHTMNSQTWYECWLKRRREWTSKGCQPWRMRTFISGNEPSDSATEHGSSRITCVCVKCGSRGYLQHDVAILNFQAVQKLANFG